MNKAPLIAARMDAGLPGRTFDGSPIAQTLIATTRAECPRVNSTALVMQSLQRQAIGGEKTSRRTLQAIRNLRTTS